MLLRCPQWQCKIFPLESNRSHDIYLHSIDITNSSTSAHKLGIGSRCCYWYVCVIETIVWKPSHISCFYWYLFWNLNHLMRTQHICLSCELHISLIIPFLAFPFPFNVSAALLGSSQIGNVMSRVLVLNNVASTEWYLNI